MFENNVFEYLRGSVKFAGWVPGSRNIRLVRNIIKSSDNHGFECDSQSDLTIEKNSISNVLNQGIYVLVNNGPTNVSGITATISVFGTGVVGFPMDGLYIQGNIFDNCGYLPGVGNSCIRIGPDQYQDGYKFIYKNVDISDNIFRNVTNTSHIGVNFVAGSYQELSIRRNKFQDFQGLVGIQIQARGETASGFVNGIRILNNEINMNNVNSSAFGIRVETTSGTQPLNDITLDNEITGTCARRYVLGGSKGVNNVKIFNIGNAGLGPTANLIFTGTVQNLTVDGGYLLLRNTSAATQSSLLWDVTTATSKPLLNNNETLVYRALVTARNSATGDSGVYKIEGGIKQGANAASTALVGLPTVTTLGADSAASTWSVTVAADTTNGTLDLKVTGAASTSIHWSAQVDILEQFY